MFRFFQQQLWVPLHSHHKTRLLDLNCLNHAIGGMCHNLQWRCDSLHRLMMAAVDRQRRGIHNGRQPARGRNLHQMPWQRKMQRVRAMLQRCGNRVGNVLNQHPVQPPAPAYHDKSPVAAYHAPRRHAPASIRAYHGGHPHHTPASVVYRHGATSPPPLKIIPSTTSRYVSATSGRGGINKGVPPACTTASA